MKKIDIKILAIIILSVLVIILGYVAFNPKTEQYNDSLLKYTLNRLKTENDSLLNCIAVRDGEIKAFNSKIDSLQSLKPKIKIVYVEKYKEIDNANSGAIVAKFKNVFAKAGIR